LLLFCGDVVIEGVAVQEEAMRASKRGGTASHIP
jgi:hypothetical protein